MDVPDIVPDIKTKMRGKRKVKTRTLENRKGAAPKFVLAFQGCATRPPARSYNSKKLFTGRSAAIFGIFRRGDS
jgi:hypothetical protein